MKRFISSLKKYFATRLILLGVCSAGVFALTVIMNLRDDGNEIFRTQKDALTIEVFSRTDLAPESVPVVEEALRNLPDVEKVVTVSPEEALRKILSDPAFASESQWLENKFSNLKGRDSIFPWSYELRLSRWDDPSLKLLNSTLQSLEVGNPKSRVISEVRYDSERWFLAYTLDNYIRWLTTVVRSFALLLALMLLAVLGIIMKNAAKKSQFLGMLPQIAVFGAIAGLLSHILYVFICSISFFSAWTSWRTIAGKYLIIQIFASLSFALLAEASSMAFHEHKSAEKG